MLDFPEYGKEDFSEDTPTATSGWREKGRIPCVLLSIFRYFDITCLKGCPQKQLQSFVERLHRLASLGWSEIRRSRRHEYGCEYLPKDAIKQALPPIITDDVSKVMVFRYDNENHPFIGVQTENTIQLIALEVRFGELYDHG